MDSNFQFLDLGQAFFTPLRSSERAQRREQGLARAGNARVRRGMIQLAWRFTEMEPRLNST